MQISLQDTAYAKKRNRDLWKKFKSQKYLQAFVLIGILFLLIFCYIPMAGIIMAFKNYKISSNIITIFTSHWVGLKYFKEFFTDLDFLNIVRNTFVISILKIIFTFPIPIIFAIMVNEIKNLPVKRFVQTVSYLPHFISWVIVSGLVYTFFTVDNGVINELLKALNLIKEPLLFVADAKYFWGLAVATDAWKEFGWWSIIFLAAIAGIDPTLYEVSMIDGAGRLERIRYITLPSIKGAIGIVLILSIGNLLVGGVSGSNFDQSYLLGSALNRETSDIIQTYVLRVGLEQSRYSFAAAVGLIQSVLSVIFIFGGNRLSKKLLGVSLY